MKRRQIKRPFFHSFRKGRISPSISRSHCCIDRWTQVNRNRFQECRKACIVWNGRNPRRQRAILQLGKVQLAYSSGTPGICLAVRIVSEVFTLATFGAGVSLLVRNS